MGSRQPAVAERFPHLHPQYVDLVGPDHARPVALAARAFLGDRPLKVEPETVVVDVAWTVAGSMALLELLLESVNDTAESYALTALIGGLLPVRDALERTGRLEKYREEEGVRQVVLAALPEADAVALRQIGRNVYEAVEAVPGLIGDAAPPELERVRHGAVRYRHLAQECRQVGEGELADVLESAAGHMQARVEEGERFLAVVEGLLAEDGIGAGE